MRLQKLTGLERDKIIKDYNDVLALIADLEEILDSPVRVNQIIRDGFVEIKEKFGDQRKTQIIEDQDEIQIEDLIKSEEQIVTITHKGYVKRMAIDTYRTQKRGGTGVKGASTGSDEDFYTDILQLTHILN